MPLSRGDVVLVQFPYSSGAGSKLRPAVVVQPDHNNRRLTNVILVPITTTIQRAGESAVDGLAHGATFRQAEPDLHFLLICCLHAAGRYNTTVGSSRW